MTEHTREQNEARVKAFFERMEEMLTRFSEGLVEDAGTAVDEARGHVTRRFVEALPQDRASRPQAVRRPFGHAHAHVREDQRAVGDPLPRQGGQHLRLHPGRQQHVSHLGTRGAGSAVREANAEAIDPLPQWLKVPQDHLPMSEYVRRVL